MISCNTAVSALANQQDDPARLYVHGSVMLLHEEDEVQVTGVGPDAEDLKTLVVNLKIRVVNGRTSTTVRPFFYEEHGDHVGDFERVVVRKEISYVENGQAPVMIEHIR